MRFSKNISKAKIKRICREYIAQIAVNTDELVGFDDCILKLITAKNPVRAINQLKKQYSPVVEVYANLDNIYDADISIETACELVRVDMDTSDMFDVTTWTGQFCAVCLHDYIDEITIDTIIGLSNDVKYDTATELIASNNRDISEGYKVTWRYTAGVLKQLQGDNRVRDLIESIELKYVL